MIRHVVRRELAARWVLLPASIVIGALAMIAIASIGHVRGDADGFMNGTWVATLAVSFIVGMSLLGEELSNSRLSFYFARPFSPSAIFGGKLAAGVLLALVMQIAIVILVALALPELSWRGSTLAQRNPLSIGGERILSTVGCTLLGMAWSIATASKGRWFVIDLIGASILVIVSTWFALSLEPDPYWLPAEATRSVGQKALLHSIAFAIAAVALWLATSKALVRGRTDRIHAHRVLTTTLWPIVVPAMVALAAVAAVTNPDIPDPPAVLPDRVRAPEVTREYEMDTSEPVPYLLLLDEHGVLRLGAAASWEKLDAGLVRVSGPIPQMELGEQLFPWIINGTTGALSVASVPVIEDQVVQAREVAERQRQSERAQEARRLTREHKNVSRRASTPGLRYTSLALDLRPALFAANDAFWNALREKQPFSAARVAYFQWYAAPVTPLQPLLAAHPRAPAASLLEILGWSGAWLAISHESKIRAFGRMSYTGGYQTPVPWIEVRVSRSKIFVEVVPDTPREVRDIGELETTLANLRLEYGLGKTFGIDVLVSPDVDAQRFTDVWMAAGTHSIGLGLFPSPAQLALRGHLVPIASYVKHDYQWTRLALGDSNEAKLRACREAAFAEKPFPRIIRAQLVVDDTNRTRAANGVSSKVEACIEAALGPLVFPPTRPNEPRSLQIEFRR